MKLFSLKKDTDSSTETPKSLPNPSEAKGNLELPELPQATTSLPSADTSIPVPNAAITKPVVDEFALDSIDLNALEDELFKNSTTPSVAATQDGLDKEFSFDDFDLGDPTPIPAADNVINNEQAKALVEQHVTQSQHETNDLNLDDFDIEVPVGHVATVQENTIQENFEEKANADTLKQIEATNLGLEKPTLDNKPLEPEIHTLTTPATPTLDNDVTATAKTNEDVGVMGKKAKVKSPKVSKPFINKTTTPKNNPKLLYILLPVAALAIGGWYFMTQQQEEPTATKATAPIVKPKPKPASVVASTPVATVASEPVATIASTTTTASATTASAASATAGVITPDEILKPSLPQDTAIAKEEMDRLADQSNQLKEQESMMEEQLRMMNELSDKKEERIKLLEQQIAQVEQQKAPAKP